jgi:hypothetical protein
MSHFQEKNCTLSWKAVNAQLKREKKWQSPTSITNVTISHVKSLLTITWKGFEYIARAKAA